jgi:hypothetical protein
MVVLPVPAFATLVLMYAVVVGVPFGVRVLGAVMDRRDAPA